MKRTNIVLDEQLLEEATRLSGERTYSRTVERALEEFVKRAKARRIFDLAGSGLWQGDLSVVREDAPAFGDRPASKRPALSERSESKGVYRTKRTRAASRARSGGGSGSR